MRSDTVKKGFQRAPHRSLLRACGLSDDDINKPFVGIANSFCEIVPGHVHLNKVGEVVKQAIRRAGGTAFEFNTIAVCDGIGRGHRSMSRSSVRDYKASKAHDVINALCEFFYSNLGFELRAKNNLIFGFKTTFLKTRTIRVISPPAIFLTKGQGFGIN